MATTAVATKVPSKKEDIDVKASKTEYIREAFTKLGLDTPANEIAAYIKTQYDEAIKPQYIYLIKSKMVNPNKKPAKRVSSSTESKARSTPRKQTGGNSQSQGNQFTETYASIQSLIRYFGNKNELIKVINAI